MTSFSTQESLILVFAGFMGAILIVVLMTQFTDRRRQTERQEEERNRALVQAEKLRIVQEEAERRRLEVEERRLDKTTGKMGG